MKILFLTVIVLVTFANALPQNFLNFGKHTNGQLENGGKIWVVLVAGSNTYSNYRHQADICHAYQISHKNGIPDNQIIVFMFDDIANDPENPFPGTVINKPNGPDVYKGVPKDYTGEDQVLPNIMLAALRGDKDAVKNVGSEKVVDSGPNDHIFVYFADHGGEGLICFPNFENNLYADDLNKALNDLHTNNRFAKLVFYLESCESGSMFETLATNISIYATTAAGTDESSWGTYCDDPKMNTCLGDEYSVAWMEDSDSHDISKELLNEQFENVKTRVQMSTPHEWGDLTIGKNNYCGEFQGNNGIVSKESSSSHSTNQGKKINSRDVPLELLKMKIKRAKEDNIDSRALEIKLRIMEQKRNLLRDTTKNIVLALAKSETEAHRLLTIRTRATDNMSCYKQSVEYYIRKCFPMSQYYLGQMYVLANLCNNGFDHESIKTAMDSSCLAPIPGVD